MLSSDNNNNFYPNEINSEKNLFKQKNLYNKNKKNFPLMKNKQIEEPIYVMTVELEKGKNESIKIFQNSKPGELAYDFCKNHNLDFSSLSYLTEEITNLFKNLSNDNKEKNLNEPIEEVDEDEYVQSLDNIYKKKKSNLDNQQLNINNNDNNINIINYINNDNNNNIFENNLNENQKEFQIMDLNNNNKINEGQNDLIDDFDNFEKDIIKEEEIRNESMNLDSEFENENNINNNIIDINDEKITDYTNINSNEDKNQKLKTNDKIKEEEKNLKENFDFYHRRKKVISYEQFYNNFKKNLINHPDFLKKKIENNNKLNKEYKSFNLDIKRVNQKYPIENNIENIIDNNNYLLTETFSENSVNIKEKLKSNLKKTKKINKNVFIQNDQEHFSNNPINLENFISKNGALDEVYQNKINDESIFLSKLKFQIQNNNSKRTKLTLQDFTDLCRIHSFQQNPSLKQVKKSYSSQHKKSNKNFFGNLPKSERNKNSLYKSKRSRLRIGNDNIKNNSFSPSITSSNMNSKTKMLLNNNGVLTTCLSKTNNKYQKKNSYIKFKNNNFSPDKRSKSEKKNFIEKKSIMKNDKIDEFDVKKMLQKVFILLDFDNKGYIDLNNCKINNIPIQIIIILSPIFNKTRNKNHISMNEFISIGHNILNKIPFEDKRTLFKFSTNN